MDVVRIGQLNAIVEDMRLLLREAISVEGYGPGGWSDWNNRAKAVADRADDVLFGQKAQTHSENRHT